MSRLTYSHLWHLKNKISNHANFGLHRDKKRRKILSSRTRRKYAQMNGVIIPPNSAFSSKNFTTLCYSCKYVPPPEQRCFPGTAPASSTRLPENSWSFPSATVLVQTSPGALSHTLTASWNLLPFALCTEGKNDWIGAAIIFVMLPFFPPSNCGGRRIQIYSRYDSDLGCWWRRGGEYNFKHIATAHWKPSWSCTGYLEELHSILADTWL